MARKHHIVKGDRVKVIRGNYRELEGTVLEVLSEQDRVRVEGVNQRNIVRDARAVGRSLRTAAC